MKYNQTGRMNDCKRYPLTSTFRPFGVPPQAVFEGIEYLGAEAAGLGLMVDQFLENHEGLLYHSVEAGLAGPTR